MGGVRVGGGGEREDDCEVQDLLQDWREGENKLLVPKFDSFIKHSSLKKCIIVKPRMVVRCILCKPQQYTCEEWEIVCFHKAWHFN